MSLPTLLKPNAILPQKWMTKEQKAKLNNLKSIEWIIEYINDRTWLHGISPKIPIKGPGSRVGVFRSGTGTGKSTIIPPALYTYFYEHLGIHKNIVCTQPTVATAVDIPYQIITHNKNLALGLSIGYQTGSLVRKPAKGILFATVGILLQHIKTLTDDQFMRKYSFIIIDEVHTRSIEQDTLMYYLRELLKRNYDNPECPYIILTSGTFDPDIYLDYFKCPADAFLDIMGSSFPIDDHFTKLDVSNYEAFAMYLIEKYHLENLKDLNQPLRDILVFVPGSANITRLVEQINDLNSKVLIKGSLMAREHLSQIHDYDDVTGAGNGLETASICLCPIAVTSANIQKGEEDYQNLFSPIESVSVSVKTDSGNKVVPASRRVIIGTNAIETGLTIDTLKVCIDTGMVNDSQFNPNYGCMVLFNKNVNQASSRQRRGRVGRKAPGVFYACYTKKVYDQMPSLPLPAILRSDLTNFMLDIIMKETDAKLEQIKADEAGPRSFQINKFDQWWYELKYDKPFRINSMKLVQSPAADTLAYSIEKLHTLGFIDQEYKPTLFGYYGSKFRKLTIENIRMILAGYHLNANVLGLITIACFIQSDLNIKWGKYTPINYLGMSSNEMEYYYQFVIADELIEYLFIWEDINPTKLEQWCSERKISYQSISSIINLRDEVIEDLLSMGLNPFFNKMDLTKLMKKNLHEGLAEIYKMKKCIQEGYQLNILEWNDVLEGYVNRRYLKSVLDSKLIIPLKLDEDIQQQRPKKIIAAQLIIKPGQDSYEFVGSGLSVILD